VSPVAAAAGAMADWRTGTVQAAPVTTAAFLRKERRE
jgi:hypothetical protein